MRELQIPTGVDGDDDATEPSQMPLGPVLPGETWNFQLWFRDKNPGTTSNFTDGVSVTFF